MNTTPPRPPEVPTDESLGDNVRAAREAAGLNQVQLAERLTAAGFPELSRAMVSRVELGKRKISHREALAIAAALGIPVAQLSASTGELTPTDAATLEARETLHRLQAGIVRYEAAGHSLTGLIHDATEAESLVIGLGDTELAAELSRAITSALTQLNRRDYAPLVDWVDETETTPGLVIK